MRRYHRGRAAGSAPIEASCGRVTVTLWLLTSVDGNEVNMSSYAQPYDYRHGCRGAGTCCHVRRLGGTGTRQVPSRSPRAPRGGSGRLRERCKRRGSLSAVARGVLNVRRDRPVRSARYLLVGRQVHAGQGKQASVIHNSHTYSRRCSHVSPYRGSRAHRRRGGRYSLVVDVRCRFSPGQSVRTAGNYLVGRFGHQLLSRVQDSMSSVRHHLMASFGGCAVECVAASLIAHSPGSWSIGLLWGEGRRCHTSMRLGWYTSAPRYSHVGLAACHRLGFLTYNSQCGLSCTEYGVRIGQSSCMLTSRLAHDVTSVGVCNSEGYVQGAFYGRLDRHLVDFFVGETLNYHMSLYVDVRAGRCARNGASVLSGEFVGVQTGGPVSFQLGLP